MSVFVSVEGMELGTKPVGRTKCHLPAREKEVGRNHLDKYDKKATANQSTDAYHNSIDDITSVSLHHPASVDPFPTLVSELQTHIN